eukprot:TRINITY_DN56548_c0_g1_i1.p1 TRINITY_DN56548_c0_g1~~TRINITY_DN56548_c0_g1_i1.p1  ORF type:complete len:509 (-),score=50.76 TRINITY_DN56548_c0_g1_i1:99-1574(-)
MVAHAYVGSLQYFVFVCGAYSVRGARVDENMPFDGKAELHSSPIINEQQRFENNLRQTESNEPTDGSLLPTSLSSSAAVSTSSSIGADERPADFHTSKSLPAAMRSATSKGPEDIEQPDGKHHPALWQVPHVVERVSRSQPYQTHEVESRETFQQPATYQHTSVQFRNRVPRQHVRERQRDIMRVERPSEQTVVHEDVVPSRVRREVRREEVIPVREYREVLHQSDAPVHEYRDFDQEIVAPYQEHREIVREAVAPCQDQREILQEYVPPCRGHREILHEMSEPCQEHRVISKETEVPCQTHRDILQEPVAPCQEEPLIVQEHQAPCRERRHVFREAVVPEHREIVREAVAPCQEHLEILHQREAPCQEYRDIVRETVSPCREHRVIVREADVPCQKRREIVRHTVAPCHEQQEVLVDNVAPCQEHREVVREALAPCQDRQTIVREKAPAVPVHEVGTYTVRQETSQGVNEFSNFNHDYVHAEHGAYQGHR